YTSGAMPPESAYLSGGFLGPAYAPVWIGKDHTHDPSAPNFRVKEFDAPADISSERLGQRFGLLQQLDPRAEQTSSSTTLRNYQERAYDLITKPEAVRAFDVKEEPAKVRDWYGMHPLGQNLLMARRLIEAGVRLVSVVGWTGYAPGDKPGAFSGSIETWDMH